MSQATKTTCEHDCNAELLHTRQAVTGGAGGGVGEISWFSQDQEKKSDPQEQTVHAGKAKEGKLLGVGWFMGCSHLPVLWEVIKLLLSFSTPKLSDRKIFVSVLYQFLRATITIYHKLGA